MCELQIDLLKNVIVADQLINLFAILTFASLSLYLALSCKLYIHSKLDYIRASAKSRFYLNDLK